MCCQYGKQVLVILQTEMGVILLIKSMNTMVSNLKYTPSTVTALVYSAATLTTTATTIFVVLLLLLLRLVLRDDIFASA